MYFAFYHFLVLKIMITLLNTVRIKNCTKIIIFLTFLTARFNTSLVTRVIGTKTDNQLSDLIDASYK